MYKWFVHFKLYNIEHFILFTFFLYQPKRGKKICQRFRLLYRMAHFASTYIFLIFFNMNMGSARAREARYKNGGEVRTLCRGIKYYSNIKLISNFKYVFPSSPYFHNGLLEKLQFYLSAASSDLRYTDNI